MIDRKEAVNAGLSSTIDLYTGQERGFLRSRDLIPRPNNISARDQESSIRKWRYFYIDRAARSLSDEDLISEVDSIFADFGYPPDMESIVSFMPAHSDERSILALASRIRGFVRSMDDHLNVADHDEADNSEKH